MSIQFTNNTKLEDLKTLALGTAIDQNGQNVSISEGDIVTAFNFASQTQLGLWLAQNKQVLLIDTQAQFIILMAKFVHEKFL